MPDIPEEAIQAAAEAIGREYESLREWDREAFARAALEAAMPVLEERFRQEIGGWLLRVGQRVLRDEKRDPEPDNLGFGWAGAFIGAGIMVEDGHPKIRRGDDA